MTQQPDPQPQDPYGQASPPGPSPYGQPEQQANKGRVFSIIGIVCGVVSLLFVPIVFGPLGVAMGFLADNRGDKPLGKYVGIGCIVTTILGFVIGALVYSAANN